MIERYTQPKMAKIWEEENRFRKMLEIEVLACEALCDLGQIPTEAFAHIKKLAKFDLTKIKEIESNTQHDIVAFVENLIQSVGESGKYIHMGLTSSDILDTALACQMREAADILIEGLKRLIDTLGKQARKYKDVVMVARTHGVHAEPTTFGLKLAVFYEEARRGLARLARAREAINAGKISGAVGTYANMDMRVEAFVCHKLGLTPASVSSQIVQRDRHAEFLTTLALIGASLEKFALEIRALARTELREVEEPFAKGQKGSSAMPHKRNPVICERICGLARVLRGNALAAMEDVALWHERDISHSSVERIVVPDSTILLDYMLNKMEEVLANMLVYPENMKANLERTRGLIFSGSVLVDLIKNGMTRKEAYEHVQDCAMRAWRDGVDFREELLRDREVARYLNGKDMDESFSLKRHLKEVDMIFKRVGLG